MLYTSFLLFSCYQAQLSMTYVSLSIVYSIPTSFLVTAAKHMRTAPFWVITQRVVVILYRRFGTTFRFHIQGSRRDPLGCSETSVWTRFAITQKNTVLLYYLPALSSMYTSVIHVFHPYRFRLFVFSFLCLSLLFPNHTGHQSTVLLLHQPAVQMRSDRIPKSWRSSYVLILESGMAHQISRYCAT
jgi:hypothetical protein